MFHQVSHQGSSMLKGNLFLVRVGGEWLLDLHVKFVLSTFRGFKTYLYLVDSDKKNLDEIRPVPTMYSSKRTPCARPPSLLYTSPESMKFIKEHDKDASDSFDKERSRQTRASSARSNAKKVCFRKEKGPTSEGATEETGEPEGPCEGAGITGAN